MSERRVFPTVDAALETFPWWPEANIGFVRDKLDGLQLEITEIYTPPMRSYIGLRIAGADTIVSLHFGYIAGLRDDAGNKYWIDNPINKLRDGDGPPKSKRRAGSLRDMRDLVAAER